jgi:hypothetical protein
VDGQKRPGFASGVSRLILPLSGSLLHSPQSRSAAFSCSQRQRLMGGWGIAQRCPSIASTGAALRYAPATHWSKPARRDKKLAVSSAESAKIYGGVKSTRRPLRLGGSLSSCHDKVQIDLDAVPYAWIVAC